MVQLELRELVKYTRTGRVDVDCFLCDSCMRHAPNQVALTLPRAASSLVVQSCGSGGKPRDARCAGSSYTAPSRWLIIGSLCPSASSAPSSKRKHPFAGGARGLPTSAAPVSPPRRATAPTSPSAGPRVQIRVPADAPRRVLGRGEPRLHVVVLAPGVLYEGAAAHWRAGPEDLAPQVGDGDHGHVVHVPQHREQRHACATSARRRQSASPSHYWYR